MTGGSKHSLFLDTEGHLWYSGSPLSVGIEAEPEAKQMVPTRLATKETFMLISSSESINMALSKTSKVYVFGLMKTQGRQELIKFQQTPFPESVHYVACGPQHFLAIDDQGSAYSWGSTTNGRLGHSLTGLSMINQSARQRSLDIVL